MPEELNAPPPTTATVQLPASSVRPSRDPAHPDPAAEGYDPGASTGNAPTPRLVLGGPGAAQFRDGNLELPQERHARLHSAPAEIRPRPRVPQDGPAEPARPALPAPEGEKP